MGRLVGHRQRGPDAELGGDAQRGPAAQERAPSRQHPPVDDQRGPDHAEERPGGAGAEHVVRGHRRRRRAHAGEQVEGQEAAVAEDPLHHPAPAEAEDRVGQQVDPADVEEDRGEQPPPLARGDETAFQRAGRDQRLAAGRIVEPPPDHQQHGDVDGHQGGRHRGLGQRGQAGGARRRRRRLPIRPRRGNERLRGLGPARGLLHGVTIPRYTGPRRGFARHETAQRGTIRHVSEYIVNPRRGPRSPSRCAALVHAPDAGLARRRPRTSVPLGASWWRRGRWRAASR